MLKDRLAQDLKSAMLAGDKTKVSHLKSIKSAILYAEVEARAKNAEINDSDIIQILQKEAKKRQESADLFRQGGDSVRAQAELDEKALIEQYLPKQMTEDELLPIVQAVVDSLEQKDRSQMGKAIAEVRSKTAGKADGSLIAKLVAKLLGN